MYKFPYWLGLACLLANPAAAQFSVATPSPARTVADEQPLLSLPAAQALALEKNAGIAAAGNEVKATEGALQQAGARPIRNWRRPWKTRANPRAPPLIN